MEWAVVWKLPTELFVSQVSLDCLSRANLRTKDQPAAAHGGALVILVVA
jgi:hypothetical protein